MKKNERKNVIVDVGTIGTAGWWTGCTRDWHIECNGCGQRMHRKNKACEITLDFLLQKSFLCMKCLKALREQIDAFRILVLTGEDTK